jgi:hypothetical protein
MIVTFRPTINNTSDVTACYLNFLRCVTAIATAAAGTTTLTVNPYVATGNIDATKNCIISIDSNTEAGGWTTSASHNVPSSGNNTPIAYTAINSAAAYLYKADFYNASGKGVYPYKKLCFHTYNSSTGYNHWGGSGQPMPDRTAITASAAANMLITFGCSSSTDWTSTTFPPAANNAAARVNDASTQSTSYTLNGNTSNGSGTGCYNQGPGLFYTDTSIDYHMAVTADYCIIWESKIGDTWTNGYFATTTTGGGTTYWNRPRYGSIYYMGLRNTQAWENSQAGNVPWVCWQYTGDTYASGGVTAPFSHNQVAAFMLTYNNSGFVSNTPSIFVTANSYAYDYFNGYLGNTREQGSVGHYVNPGKELDGPLFITRAMGNGANVASGTQTGNSANMLYMPQTDPVTGAQVPGAYPINISRGYTDSWNAGGSCRGIYKSISMPYATIKYYWQAPGQTFTINGDTYLPFVINEDMWLVRFA